VRVDDPEEATRELAAELRRERVAFFDGNDTPSMTSVEDAIDRWRHAVSDALVSFTPGQVAVLLFHEGWGWRCRR
jgi:hypothetical protein